MRIALLISMLVCTGCASRLADLTIASTRNLGMNVNLAEAEHLGRYEGYDTCGIFLGISLGPPNLAEAIDSALLDAGGHLMINVAVYREKFSIWLIGSDTLVVRGEVYRLPGVPAPEPASEGAGRLEPETDPAPPSGGPQPGAN